MESRITIVNSGSCPVEVATLTREAGRDLLVFFHGWGCSGESFHHCWGRADFDDYSILAIDLIGFGRSAKASEFSYMMEDQAKICAELLSKYAQHNLHFVVHSMGGAIALLVAEDILNSLKTFANIEGNLTAADCGTASRKTVSVSPEIFSSKILPEFENQFAGLGKGYFDLNSTADFALYRSAESLVNWSDNGSLLNRFRSLDCRKSYFYGDENATHPTITALEGIMKIEIPGSGHFPMNDNPEVFYSKLLEFITTT